MSGTVTPATVVMTPAAARFHTEAEVLSPANGAPLDLTVFVS